MELDQVNIDKLVSGLEVEKFKWTITSAKPIENTFDVSFTLSGAPVELKTDAPNYSLILDVIAVPFEGTYKITKGTILDPDAVYDSVEFAGTSQKGLTQATAQSVFERMKTANFGSLEKADMPSIQD